MPMNSTKLLLRYTQQILAPKENYLKENCHDKFTTPTVPTPPPPPSHPGTPTTTTTATTPPSASSYHAWLTLCEAFRACGLIEEAVPGLEVGKLSANQTGQGGAHHSSCHGRFTHGSGEQVYVVHSPENTPPKHTQ